jgi:hypothetical protein
MSEKDLEAIQLLKQDFELGIYSQEEYEVELSKLGVEPIGQQVPDYFLTNDNWLKINKQVESIKSNLKPIAKMILENKWCQKNVNEDKIIIVSGQLEQTYNLFSITYINKYGQYISVDIKDVVTYLDKIDFDE